MSVKIHPQWKIVLYNNFDHPYFKTLISFVKSAYQKGQCYPPGELIFNAFDIRSPNETLVVFVGQYAYHGQGQANGVFFYVT